MTAQPTFEFQQRRSALAREPELISVHVLGQFVFCPRAAVLAMEAPNEDEEPGLGPQLQGVMDYQEHHFVEAIRKMSQQLGTLAILVTGVLIWIFLFWRWFSPAASMVWAIPLAFLLLKVAEVGKQLTLLVAAHGRQKAAPELLIDLSSNNPQHVSWWSLRKAGFDCTQPKGRNIDPIRGVHGKPWRTLSKVATEKIPVIRKHLGNREVRPQHEVRLAAYCALLEAAEGVDAPFGVVVFAGTDECVIIPNSPENQRRYAVELERLREFLSLVRQGTMLPAPPPASHCHHCPLGQPRKYSAATPTTDGFGRVVPPRLTNGKHSPCGDRFNWDPPRAT